MDLAAALPLLLPRAIAWAEGEAARIVYSGQILTGSALDWARKVGVTRPDLVRVEVADALPMPADPELRAAATAARLLGPDMAGLTLGYSVFLRRGFGDNSRTLVHELRHVYQYEQAGSIAAFLPVYLDQVVRLGYENAPSELDALKYGQLIG